MIFTPHEIQWRCKTRTLTETYQYSPFDYGSPSYRDFESLAISPLDSMRLLITDPDLLKLTRSATTGKPRNHFDVWYEMATAYNARALTVPSDKLLAVAGLARLMQKNFECEYGAGLWKEDLQKGLCWYIQTADHRHLTTIDPSIYDDQSYREYIATSWTWASVGKKFITYYRGYDNRSGDILEQGIEVLDWSFSYLPGALAPFGQVTSGSLTLRGHLRPLLLMPYIFDLLSHLCRKHSWEVRWSAYAIDPHKTSAFGEVALDSLEVYHDLVQRYRDINRPEYGSKSYGKLIGGDKHPPELLSKAVPATCLLTYVFEDHGRRHMAALVLTPHNTDKQTYRRIGLLFATNPAPLAEKLTFGSPDAVEIQDRQIVHIV